MYSESIVEKRLSQVSKSGIECVRRSREDCIDISRRLEKLRYDGKGVLLPDGQLSRQLDDKEQAHIRSERILCKVDFVYYATRYHAIGIDTGISGGEETIGPVEFQESQNRLVAALAKREEEVHAEYARYKLTEGIKVIAHKSRQQFYTATSRMLTFQRMLFWPGTRAFAGALNPAGSGELYKRDKIALDGLPFWLKPEVYPDVKDTEIGFKDPLNCRIMYQETTQKNGIAVGTQVDVSHLTEVPLWLNAAYDIGFSLMAAIPKSRMTLHIQEGTSSGGSGYWKDISEAARKRMVGYESWTYVFVPWYINSRKFVRLPAANWRPAKHTIEHAALIERTSPEWNGGNVYHPTVEQLCWWESERESYVKSNSLAAFLATYPATPEMSFTNWSEGALPVELIEKMEMDERRPGVYAVEVAG